MRAQANTAHVQVALAVVAPPTPCTAQGTLMMRMMRHQAYRMPHTMIDDPVVGDAARLDLNVHALVPHNGPYPSSNAVHVLAAARDDGDGAADYCARFRDSSCPVLLKVTTMTTTVGKERRKHQ